ncbi:MAG TPA: LysM domain-containing protein [Thermoleophilaceae bacterium]
MEKRTRKSPARFLAPLALIAVLVAFLAIVTNSGGGGSSTTEEPSTSSATQTSTTTKKKASTPAKKKAAQREDAGKTYTVQVGDTLGGIADKTGVPLERIEELNPNVDPHAMTTGQEIKLK